ncbi:MAG: hypothetical protein ABWY20_09800 [Mycobacterium sp.]
MPDSYSGAACPATGVLVETLLARGAEGDVREAEAAVDRLAVAPAGGGFVARETWVLPTHAADAGTR